MNRMDRTESREGNVTIVIQTRVRPECDDAFAAWQAKTSAIVAAFPGFVERSVLQPSPPAQVDWVIQQRFISSQAAVAWLTISRSRCRSRARSTSRPVRCSASTAGGSTGCWG